MSNKFKFTEKERKGMAIRLEVFRQKSISSEDTINLIEEMLQSRQPEIVNEVGDDEDDMDILSCAIANLHLDKDSLKQKIKTLQSELSTLREQNTAYELTMDNFYKEREFLQGQISGLLDERKWISVDDRLPNHYNPVFVIGKNGVRIGRYNSVSHWFYNNGVKLSKAITHWMPLPTKPIHQQNKGE